MMSKLSVASQLFSLNLEDRRIAIKEIDLDNVEEIPVSENFPVEGNFHELGVVETPVAVQWSSKLIPSPVIGILAPTQVAPAHLRPVLVDDSYVNPLYKSLSKAGNIPSVLDYRYLSYASTLVSHMIIESSEVKPFFVK